MSEEASDPDRMRLDIWLWRARLFKTRALAADAISGVGARIERDGQTRRIDKPATSVAPGDLVAITTPAGPQLVRILLLPDRRGPASEAALSYARVEVR